MATTYRTRTKNRVSPQVKLRSLAARAGDLYRRAEAGEPMGPRDVAQAAEYHQQYVELLEEMEHMPMEIERGIVTEVNERRIRFPGIDAIAEWMAEVMSK